MVALLFPGQGSQAVGMGRDLAEAFPAARAAFEEADAALGVPLSRIMWEGPAEELTLTHNAQPALLTHSVAAFRVTAEALGDVRFAAGHSLGEFSAYVAAGTLDFADAVRAVRRRGELMLSSGEDRPGTMAALVGLDDEGVEAVCREASDGGGVCVAANFNAPGQVVISGDVPTVQRAMDLAKDAGAKRAIRLNVSGAFHSPLMAVAEAGLHAVLDSVELRDPRVPVVSNVTAAPVTRAADARRLLVEQLTSPVRWAASMRAIREAGVERFIELGPGSVLTGLLRRIDRAASCDTVGTAEEVRSRLDEARRGAER
ncbi:MAG TPA: ACP S-malonyltransferase [Longimicrobiales bacterium]|nr:ACP S-malonyltransferase [Longimicrobiales bacterium]